MIGKDIFHKSSFRGVELPLAFGVLIRGMSNTIDQSSYLQNDWSSHVLRAAGQAIPNIFEPFNAISKDAYFWASDLGGILAGGIFLYSLIRLYGKR